MTEKEKHSAATKLFDTHLRTLKQKRARTNFDNHDFLHQWSDRVLIDRLEDVNRSFENAVHIGNLFQKSTLPNSSKIKNFLTLDETDGQIIAHEETLPLKDNAIDLITSNLCLHTHNDLPGTLIQIKRALKPDGLFLSAMLGGETLYELRESLQHAEITLKGGISPRIFPFADKQQMGALLQRAGFALPVVDSEIITVTYESIFKLMHDLRGMGQSNIINERSRKNPGKALFMEAGRYYQENFSDPDGRIRASFEVIFLIGWLPHDSQQQPLKPGSAKQSLANALNTEETKI